MLRSTRAGGNIMAVWYRFEIEMSSKAVFVYRGSSLRRFQKLR